VGGTRYEISTPTWCDTVNEYGNPTAFIVLNNKYFGLVELSKEKMIFQPSSDIPSGTWVCGTCVLINYPL
jgi:hypothetical protein